MTPLTSARWRRTVAAITVSLAVAAGNRSPGAEGKPLPYEQTAVIEARAETGGILGLCALHGGGIAAVTGVHERYGAVQRNATPGKAPNHRVVWFDSTGETVRSVSLDFRATVVAAGVEGDLYVAGDGVIMRMSSTGREVGRGTTPRAPNTPEERAELEQAAARKQAAQLAAHNTQVERLRVAIAAQEDTVRDAEAAVTEAVEAGQDERGESLRQQQESRLRRVRMQAIRMQAQLRSIEDAAEKIRAQDPAESVAQALRKTRQVRAISAFVGGVVVVVGEESGYGFAAWLLDDRLQNPRKVLANLMGCCGQMDVQAIGGRLAIAANRKHCVELCSLDGDQLGTVGARAAAGDDGAGFGGCCNPMNTCPGPDGSLLTSESNGIVKRFDKAGRFIEVVGRAEVRGGCKNSAIAIEPDGSRLYYLDSSAGNVLVLTRAAQQDAAGEDSEPTFSED